MILLTGCQTKSNTTISSINLPEFPLISINSNKELKTVFNPVCIETKKHIQKIKENIAEYKQNETENINKIKNSEKLLSELNVICSPKSKYTKEWLDELYKFKIRYYIYKEELK